MTKLRGNPWAVLVVVSLGFFMTLLDLTIVNIAIPNMILKLHATLDDVEAEGSGALVISVARAEAGSPDAVLGTLEGLHPLAGHEVGQGKAVVIRRWRRRP